MLFPEPYTQALLRLAGQGWDIYDRQCNGALKNSARPYVQVRVAGELSRQQKQEIAARFTKTLEGVAGKPPEATCRVEEVSKSG